MEENAKYLRVVPQIGYYLKEKNIASICKYKCLLFAAGGAEGRIYLFSNSLEHMSTLRGHEYFIGCLCAFPNKILASGSGGNIIKIWDTEERRLISTLSGHTDLINALCYVREGVFVSGSFDNSLIVWSKQPESYICSQRLTEHTTIITGIIRLSNTEIASGDQDGDLKLWDIDEGCCIRYIPNVDHYNITQMKIGIEGEVAVSSIHQVNVWGVANIWYEKLESEVCEGGSIEFLSKDLLLRGGDKGELEFIDYKKTGNELPMTIELLHSDVIHFMQRIAGNIVVTASEDGYLKVIGPISKACYLKLKIGDAYALAYFYMNLHIMINIA